ncbi:MAG TPA: alternative ribosome rescue aminoacyl-tRNA hydrolase ArfB [Actinomycetota bacterium]|nr:alternative ribosome rescue aminoacyl-tRNA hydrolase ArfB [Actinomycetota bacterium]
MDGIRVSRGLVIPSGELELRFSRSGGPGGQNVNTRDTRVEVVFDVAGSPSLGPRQRARVIDRLGGRLDAEGRLRVVASEERSQAQNRELAVNRLRDLLAEALRPDPSPRRPTRPTKASAQRRLAAKRARGRLKRDRSTVPDD